jgi:hypothetical protein
VTRTEPRLRKVVPLSPYAESSPLMSRAAYEIRAVGEVPPRLLEDFPGVTVSIDVAGSTIRADLADEAELRGVLDALRRGGYTLVDVRRETDYSEAWEPEPPAPGS